MIREARPGAKIAYKQNDLPFPAGFDGTRLKGYLPDFRETDLKAGIRQTIAHFEACLADGRL